MATVQGGRVARNARTWPRRSFLRKTTAPALSAPCSWKMYLARSSPTVLTWFMDASVRGLQRPHSGTPRPPGASTPSGPVHPIMRGLTTRLAHHTMRKWVPTRCWMVRGVATWTGAVAVPGRGGVDGLGGHSDPLAPKNKPLVPEDEAQAEKRLLVVGHSFSSKSASTRRSHGI